MAHRTGTLLLPLLCLAILAAALACRPAEPEAEAEAGTEVEAIAGVAADFALEDINPASATYGQTLRLSKLWGGEGIVLNFMASWCMPCREELPVLQSIHSSGDARIVCVAADEDGRTADVLSIVAQTGLTVPVLFAPPAEAAELARGYAHEFLPATYLIGKDGKILEMISGARPESVFREVISATLPGPAARRR